MTRILSVGAAAISHMLRLRRLWRSVAQHCVHARYLFGWERRLEKWNVDMIGKFKLLFKRDGCGRRGTRQGEVGGGWWGGGLLIEGRVW